jgi:ribosome-associated protein
MNKEILNNELRFSFIRSGGPGGQHANKVSSKVVLLYDVSNSAALTELEKERILEKLSSRLNKKNQIILTCDESRSQFKNKQIAVNRLMDLLEMNLREDKKRIPVKISKQEKARRLEAKRKHGQRKKFRQKPNMDE